MKLSIDFNQFQSIFRFRISVQSMQDYVFMALNDLQVRHPSILNCMMIDRSANTGQSK